MGINMAHPQIVSLYHLFSGKIFRVPEYQRSYAWEQQNWIDFWNDIRDGLLTNTEHYWGTITLQSTKERIFCDKIFTEFKVYEVIDGQQRLTTLSLLLLAISKSNPNIPIKDNFLKCGNIYRLQLGSLNNDFFKALIDDTALPPELTTNKLLKDAFDYFKNQVTTLEKHDLNKLAKYIQNKTFALEFDVQDDTLAIKSFMSLNTRGKQTSLLDNTKAFLLFYATLCFGNSPSKLDSLKYIIAESFGKIYKYLDLIKDLGKKAGITYLSNLSENEILRFFYHYFIKYAINKYKLNRISYDPRISAKDVYEQFLTASLEDLKNRGRNIGDFNKIFDFITDFCENFKNFTLALKNIAKKTNISCYHRKVFGFLGLNAALYPLVLSLETEGLLDDYMLRAVETLDIRVYKTRDSSRYPFANLYRDTIINIKLNPKQSWIYKNIKNLINTYLPDSYFRSLLEQNAYDNPAIKYMLWEYEKFKEPNFEDCNFKLYKKFLETAEHIYPQNSERITNYSVYGFADEQDYLSTINKFGNLCLLTSSENAEVKELLPENKASKYIGFTAPRTKWLGSYISTHGFHKKDIERFTNEILDFCLDRWKLT